MTDEQQPRRGAADDVFRPGDVPVYDYRPAHAQPPVRARRVPGEPNPRSLRRSLLLTLASTVLPGSGLLGAPQRGLKVLGGVTATLALVALGYLGFKAVKDQAGLAKLAASESFLAVATPTLALLAVLWVALVLVTHLATRPPALADGRRLVAAVVVAALSFATAAPTALAARYTRDASLLLNNVLADSGTVVATRRPTLNTEGPDPWAGIPRVNILLLGADGDKSRAENVAKYGIRTDTIMVASIDTATGDLTLIQIPRNVQYTPFPEGTEMHEAFPNGFRGEPEGDFFVNSIWEHVEGSRPDLFEGSTYRGAEALKQGVEGITGLPIDYFVMLNIDGMKALIDAMGGVTVNVNRRLGIGGNTDRNIPPTEWISPGPNQHLMGREGLWYGRSRWGVDDYDRMARQSCLVNAIIDQANPQTLLTSFEPIAAASGDMLTTDIPRQDLSGIIDLAFRVKDSGSVRRLVFTNGNHGYVWANPDFDAMREAVAKAIAPKPAKSPKPTKTKDPETTTPATSASSEPAQDVADACAYNPEEG
ncbi:MAG: LCP family protein [Tessaracoccus sp.]|uniref:LCP family protein n=1 Tax=Tessaracoccus sp. TaxID=1971211 RepID=UPI001ED5D132|nr:LCP family protein [Tessaracoccus sp.]MBK7820117.1 LCP family protein [Tessaracoccus sp.]